jgi:hypothetical protein
MMQTEEKSLAELATRGRDLARQLEYTTRPAELLQLAEQIEEICGQVREQTH